MRLPTRTAGAGEEVVGVYRRHGKALVLPALATPIVVGFASYALFAVPPGPAQRPARLAVLVVAAALLGWLALAPYLRWRTTMLVLTTRRLVLRSGVLARSWREVPLDRITDVVVTQRPVDRLFRCGTLAVEPAGERGPLVFSDLPRVAQVQRDLRRLIAAQPRLAWVDE